VLSEAQVRSKKLFSMPKKVQVLLVDSPVVALVKRASPCTARETGVGGDEEHEVSLSGTTSTTTYTTSPLTLVLPPA
jgi:hypothetical protein